MPKRVVWIRVLPIVIIALSAAGLCLQTACSGGGGNNGYGDYGYDD